jgi:arsenite methyltransferase
MLRKARENAIKSNFTNTQFISAKITSIALPDSSADVIISNCVINLVPEAEKPQVFREIFRVLKPGGRLAVSDILAKKRFTDEMKRDIALYVGCLAGASLKEEYERWMKETGFEDALVVDSGTDLMVYLTAGEDGEGEGKTSGCCDGNQNIEKKNESISCCGTATRVQVKAGCGGAEETAGGVVQDLKSLKDKYAGLDLNEWAGEFWSSVPWYSVAD